MILYKVVFCHVWVEKLESTETNNNNMSNILEILMLLFTDACASQFIPKIYHYKVVCLDFIFNIAIFYHINNFIFITNIFYLDFADGFLYYCEYCLRIYANTKIQKFLKEQTYQ